MRKYTHVFARVESPWNDDILEMCGRGSDLLVFFFFVTASMITRQQRAKDAAQCLLGNMPLSINRRSNRLQSQTFLKDVQHDSY